MQLIQLLYVCKIDFRQIKIAICLTISKILSYTSGESFESRQTSKFFENKVMELEGQVQNFERISSEKDTLIEKYKMETKEGECLL